MLYRVQDSVETAIHFFSSFHRCSA
jgi:hypothetical protein